MAMQKWWHDPLAKDIYNNLQAKEAEIPIFYSKVLAIDGNYFKFKVYIL